MACQKSLKEKEKEWGQSAQGLSQRASIEFIAANTQSEISRYTTTILNGRCRQHDG